MLLIPALSHEKRCRYIFSLSINFATRKTNRYHQQVSTTTNQRHSAVIRRIKVQIPVYCNLALILRFWPSLLLVIIKLYSPSSSLGHGKVATFAKRTFFFKTIAKIIWKRKWQKVKYLPVIVYRRPGSTLTYCTSNSCTHHCRRFRSTYF